MPLWGNVDYPSGNQKPLFANTSNTLSNSTINGNVANVFYGTVYGVSAEEASNTLNASDRVTHAGWVSQKLGTGYVKEILITDGGEGYNAAGFLTITGDGTGANASYTIANSQNSLQGFSTNPAWNTIATVTVVSGGSGYSNTANLVVVAGGANSSPATFEARFGGRAGRRFYETLVAMGSISGDDPKDNIYFRGV